MNLHLYIKIILVACDLVNKSILIIIGIRRLLKIKKDMKIDKKYLIHYSNNSEIINIKKQNWSFFSMTKFILNKLIVLLYFASMIIYFFDFDIDEDLVEAITFNAYCLISIITWLISTRLYYKEYRIYKDQTWYGSKLFWILSGIINLAHIIYIFFNSEYKSFFYETNIIRFILFGSICFISLILSFLAIFHPYDTNFKAIYKKEEEEENIKDDNDTKISTSVQDGLLYNSEDEFTNDDEMSFHNMETIKIEIFEKGNLNKKDFMIELKIKTQDFKELNFSVKIQKVKHKRNKLPINVCNFNEIILKYYKKKQNISKDVINLLKQAYNISLTLNPQRTSFTGDKKNANLLAHLYREIIKKDNQFLLDLLKFLKIKCDELINSLSEKFTSIFQENPRVEKDIERIDTLGSIFDNLEDIGFADVLFPNTSIKKEKTLEKNDYSDIKVKNNLNDQFISISSAQTPSKQKSSQKDNISFYTFLNNILTNKRFVNFQIINYEEIPHNLNFTIKTAKDNKEIFLQLNIDILHDILYDDELSSYIIDNCESLNDKKSKEKEVLEDLFNSYLNNLVYFDEKIYNLFNLNKFIKLEHENFNPEIIQRFFQDRNSNIGLCKNDIRQFTFNIKIKIHKDSNDAKDLINDGTIEITLSKNENNKSNGGSNINSKINIVKLYLIIEKILNILNKKIKRYDDLCDELSDIKICVGKLLNLIYGIAEDQVKNIQNYRIKEVLYGDTKINAIVSEFQKRFNNSKIQVDKVNQNTIDEINNEIKNLNTSLNSLINKSNLKYILFFTSFRDLIKFNYLF